MEGFIYINYTWSGHKDLRSSVSLLGLRIHKRIYAVEPMGDKWAGVQITDDYTPAQENVLFITHSSTHVVQILIKNSQKAASLQKKLHTVTYAYFSLKPTFEGRVDMKAGFYNYSKCV